MNRQYEAIKKMSYTWEYGLNFMMINNMEADVETYVFERMTRRRSDRIMEFVKAYFIAQEMSL